MTKLAVLPTFGCQKPDLLKQRHLKPRGLKPRGLKHCGTKPGYLRSQLSCVKNLISFAVQKNSFKLASTFAVLITLFSTLLFSLQLHATCEDELNSAVELTHKGNFYYNEGHKLNERIVTLYTASPFKDNHAQVTNDRATNDSQFVERSAENAKLYDFELAIYNYQQALQPLKTAEIKFAYIAAELACSDDIKSKSQGHSIKASTLLMHAKKELTYFNCQYTIVQSRKELLNSILYKQDNDFLNAQKYADRARNIIVSITGESAACSAKQVEMGQSIYHQAWDIITATNKPLEQQFYCENQLTSIALKLKDADIARNNSEINKAIQQWNSAKNQIEKLLSNEACPKTSLAWLQQKNVLATKELKEVTKKN